MCHSELVCFHQTSLDSMGSIIPFKCVPALKSAGGGIGLCSENKLFKRMREKKERTDRMRERESLF